MKSPENMPKRLRILLVPIFLLLADPDAFAQYPDEEYYPYAVREEVQPMLLTDSTLFYRAVQAGGDPYGRNTDFALPQVAIRRRGFRSDAECVGYDGLDVSYRYAAALRMLGANEYRISGIASGEPSGGGNGVRRFAFDDGVPLMPYRVSAGFTDRNYRLGLRASASGEWRRGWSGAAAVDVRTGRDMHVEGIFTHALTAALRAGRVFGSGAELSVTAILSPVMRGLRQSSVMEAFELTGDPLYNPAWGFQNGKVRNAYVRRELLPFVSVGGRIPLSASTLLALSLNLEAGIRKNSGLGWYDARTPRPDNYRYLPSWTGDAETDRVWRMRDARYTQIRWDEMIAQNRMAGGEAVYTLEDRVERPCDMRVSVSFETKIDRRLALRYGIFGLRSDMRCYKQMRDLLGARCLTDIDRFLIDDDTYRNLLQNDLRHPGRQIGTGDRFGYDYSLSVRDAGLRLQALYASDRFRASASAEIRRTFVFRTGYYEKELFPGALSYGRSRRIGFSPGSLKLAAGWAFTPRRYLELAVQMSSEPPAATSLFYQPLYNNRTIDVCTVERLSAAELSYRSTGPAADFQVACFILQTSDGIETRRYYDDMAGLYCDMSVTGIGRMAWGVEAAAELRLSYRWTLALAGSAGRYRYACDPRVTVISDTDNTVIDDRAVSRMGGCETGAAPRFTGAAGVRWFGTGGWGFRLSAGYAGGRYVDPEPLRRTSRIAGQGGVTPEAFEAFVRQERLEDAVTCDASLLKTFYFGRSRLTAALMLRNLTGSRMIYSGYESLRVRRVQTGDATFWQPHASLFMYAYPRSFYLTVGYRF